MKVRLNLATAPLENHRRFLLSVGVVGVLALGALVLLGQNALSGWSANRALRQEVSELEKQMREYRERRGELDAFFKEPATREILNRAAFLNALIEQRSFPWTRVFSDLERRLPEGVRVLNISPQMRDGRVEVKLTIGAATDRGKLAFLKTLEAAPEFSRLQVLGESRPREGGAADAVVVELAMLYDATVVTKAKGSTGDAPRKSGASTKQAQVMTR